MQFVNRIGKTVKYMCSMIVGECFDYICYKVLNIHLWMQQNKIFIEKSRKQLDFSLVATSHKVLVIMDHFESLCQKLTICSLGLVKVFQVSFFIYKRHGTCMSSKFARL